MFVALSVLDDDAVMLAVSVGDGVEVRDRDDVGEDVCV